MKIHLIAIGGAVMHNLAIALFKKGYVITGSDDEIFEPSKSKLMKYGLLPDAYGWFSEKITADLNAVILGMHAREDNPELLKAKELMLPIFSFPEYIYEQSKLKIRVVICGSHGKTTITSIIMHCMKYYNKSCDYLVGAQLEGFETMVQITDAPVIIIEGDEYYASTLDKRPKFLLYKANIILISGIAWDHFNVFPTWDNYLSQFKVLVDSLKKEDSLIYNGEDKNILQILNSKSEEVAYTEPGYYIENDTAKIKYLNKVYALKIFGRHNMQNLEGAKLVCNKLGIQTPAFYTAMESFKGAARRLELIKKTEYVKIFRDFAHSPSKVKATVEAVKEQYPEIKLIACLELHTYSSLNKNFLHLYQDTMAHADERIVYFNPHTFLVKKLPVLTSGEIKICFNDVNLKVINDKEELIQIFKIAQNDTVSILLMSSGNFDNMHFDF